MAKKRRQDAFAEIDPEELASFQRAIRRRYTDEQLLDELRASAERLGRSPTMKEFAADPGARVHPQTVIEHFGTWNAAKRAAGLVPRRFVTREERNQAQTRVVRVGCADAVSAVDLPKLVGWQVNEVGNDRTGGAARNPLKLIAAGPCD